MSELRKDPIVDRWVIVAPERARRPEMTVEHARHAPSAICPFCPGQEGHTPPELLARRAPGTQRNAPGWTLRVFPNKFPALRVEGDLNP
jgi:UDPglucose--hexose-1-phosphate uridylyltransferase